MALLIKELPRATVVSVAHRAELEAFHSRKIVLERRKGGAKLSATLISFRAPAGGGCSAGFCATAVVQGQG